MAIINTATDNQGSFIQRATGLDALGGLGSLGGLASSVIGAISSIGQTRRQKKLMNYQAELNQQMFNTQQRAQEEMYARQLADQRQLIQEEREYNDYASVKARAQKAGVNPLYALGASGGIGIQSSSGSAPSLGAASANGVSIASPDSIGSNLIAAGSTLASISRQNALLDAEVRTAEANARKAEIEAYWKDRDLSSIILNREEQTKLYSAGIKEKNAQTRWYTLDSDLKEQEKEFKETMNPMYLDQMRGTLRQQELMINKVQFENDTQREAFRAKMNESRAYVDNVYSMVNERLKNIELRAKELGLSEKQLDEVRAQRQQTERHFQRTQDFYEKQEKKKLNHQIAQGYISEANKLLGNCIDCVTKCTELGISFFDAIIPF